VKESTLFAEERRYEIVKLLDASGKLLITSLCEKFDVSPATIRSDLRALEQKGLLKRTHGGAIPARNAAFELATRAKEVERIDEKRRIAAHAATLVKDGDTIIIDTGTTTMELAKLLTEKANIKVVTNDIKITLFLEEHTNFEIFLLGGMLRRDYHCAMGATAIRQIRDLNVDKAFIGVNALSVEKGFSTPSLELANVKKAMMSAATTTIFLIDSQKLDRVSFAQIAGIDEADVLITDTGADESFINRAKAESKHLDIVVV